MVESEKQRSKGWSKWGPQVLGATVAALFLGTLPLVQWLQFSRSAGERLATDMLMPMGLMWCGLTLAIGAAFGGWLGARRLEHQRRSVTVFFLVCMWLFLTISGNKHAGRFAMATTEHPFVPIAMGPNDSKFTFDSVVLLGGGIATTPAGAPQLGPEGDRIRPVLQLWESGRVREVVVTGSSSIPGAPDPIELTTKLLISLGVPKESIVQVEGVNTAAEMRSLEQLYSSSDQSTSSSQTTSSPQYSPESQRRALVTSAFHMPRALRLAADVGLEFEPLPTAYRSSNHPVGIAASLVPTAGAMDDVSKCAKEWLAKLLGR